MDPDPNVHPDPEQLARVPLLQSLSHEQLKAIATLTSVKRIDAGRRVVGAGTPGYSFFVIQEGTASVTRDGEEMAELEPGDFFGEIALLGAHKRTATVTATSPMILVVMLGSDFRVFTRDWPEVASMLEQAITERLERSGRGAESP